MRGLNRRGLALGLLLLLLAVLLAVSPVYLAHSAGHLCCSAPHCPICETIALVDSAARGLSLLALCLLLCLTLPLALPAGRAGFCCRYTTGVLLVRCKIRMNN